LTTLVGAPQEVDGDFSCSHNDLSDLFGGPMKVRNYYASHNTLLSLNGLAKAKDISGYLCLSWNDKLPMLRLVEYDAVIIGNNKVEKIVEKYQELHLEHNISLRSAILKFQKDLIDAGFSGNAII